MTAKIAAALIEFQQQMPTVAKGKRADVPTKSGGKFSYTYADLADITAQAMPVLTDCGLAFSSCPRAKEAGGYELVGKLLHISGEMLEGALPIGGNTPQELGSSITYMRRYLFGSMTGLVTDDDDDGHLASTREKRAERLKAAPPDDPYYDNAAPEPEPMRDATRGRLYVLFDDKGVPDEAQLAGANQILGTAYTSRKQFTEKDALRLISALNKRPSVPKPAKEEANV